MPSFIPKPAVFVEYDKGSSRVKKFFQDAYKARQFYVRKLRDGKNPKVIGAKKMSTKTTKTRVAKNPAAKKRVEAAKKQTKAAPKTKAKTSAPKSEKTTVLEGRTRIKSLAILSVLKANKDGLGNNPLRVAAKFPCMAGVLKQLEAEGLIKKEEREGVRGHVFTVFSRGKVLAPVTAALKAANKEELAAAKAGHSKLSELATWDNVSGSTTSKKNKGL